MVKKGTIHSTESVAMRPHILFTGRYLSAHTAWVYLNGFTDDDGGFKIRWVPWVRILHLLKLDTSLIGPADVSCQQTSRFASLASTNRLLQRAVCCLAIISDIYGFRTSELWLDVWVSPYTLLCSSLNSLHGRRWKRNWTDFGTVCRNLRLYSKFNYLGTAVTNQN